MGSSAITLREEDCHPALFDGHTDRCDACLYELSADRCDEVARNGELLSTSFVGQETQATPQIVQDELGLRALWFALSQQQRVQFGGHFSEMLLRFVQHRTKQLD